MRPCRFSVSWLIHPALKEVYVEVTGRDSVYMEYSTDVNLN
jgi:hypothetical protein